MSNFFNLKKVYWAQNQYNPIIRDGLVAYEPFDRPRTKTYVGGFVIGGFVTGGSIIGGREKEYLVHQGIPCVRYNTFVDIDTSLYNSFTISQWNYATGLNNAFFGAYLSSTNNAYISTQDNVRRLRFHASTTVYNINYSASWCHYLMTYANKIVKFYRDGALVTTISNVDISFYRLLNARLGNETGAFSECAGFRFFSRVLSQDEITALANEFTPMT